MLVPQSDSDNSVANQRLSVQRFEGGNEVLRVGVVEEERRIGAGGVSSVKLLALVVRRGGGLGGLFIKLRFYGQHPI